MVSPSMPTTLSSAEYRVRFSTGVSGSDMYLDMSIGVACLSLAASGSIIWNLGGAL